MARPTLDALLTDPGFAQDPYPAYRLLSDQEPVYWSDAWGAWLVTRYDDVVATLRDHERFSSKGRLVELIDALPGGRARAEAGPLREHFSTSGLIHTDPPDHTRMRGLIKKAFSPRVIAAMEPRIQAIVDRVARPGGPGRRLRRGRRPGLSPAGHRHRRAAGGTAGGPRSVQGLVRRHRGLPGPGSGHPRGSARPQPRP